MNDITKHIILLCLRLLDKKGPGRPNKLKNEEYLKKIFFVLRTGSKIGFLTVVVWKELYSGNTVP